MCWSYDLFTHHLGDNKERLFEVWSRYLWNKEVRIKKSFLKENSKFKEIILNILRLELWTLSHKMWFIMGNIYMKYEHLIHCEIKKLEHKITFFKGKFYYQGEIILKILLLELWTLSHKMRFIMTNMNEVWSWYLMK